MKSKHFFSFLLLFIISFSGVPAQAEYWVKIPHWVQWTCTETSPGSGSYATGSRIKWTPIAGATKYFSDAAYHWQDILHDYPEDTRVIIGACCTNDCKKSYALENPDQYWYIWEVWAYFPDEGDLEVIKKPLVYGPVRPGDEIVYTFSYRNSGTATLDDVVLVEKLPDYFNWIYGGQPFPGNEFHFPLGSLAPGQSGSVYMKVQLVPDLPPGTDTIYNVAIAKYTGSGGSTPSSPGTPTTPTGLGMAHCDGLVAEYVRGDATYTEFPDPDPKALRKKAYINNNSHVQANSGAATLSHTLASGTIHLSQGGFTAKTCIHLTYPALSGYNLDDGTVIDHVIGGILNADEYVQVRGNHLELRVHEAVYRFETNAGKDTLTVLDGTVTAIDPSAVSHVIAAGESFEWPGMLSAPPSGPKVIATIPENLTSLLSREYTLEFTFDQAIDSIGNTSRITITQIGSGSWTLSNTLDNLTASSHITYSWSPDKKKLTINFSNYWAQLEERDTPAEHLALLELSDVHYAGGTLPSLNHALYFFNTRGTDAQGRFESNNIFRHLGFSQATAGQLEGNKKMAVRILAEPPGTLPAGMFLASKVYQFTYSGSITGNYNLSLKPTARVNPPSGDLGGGLYQWKNGAWQQLKAGFGSEWTSAAVSDPDAIVALLMLGKEPQRPRIVSLSHTTPQQAVTANTPLIFEVESPYGIDERLTYVSINGKRVFLYDPRTKTVPNWDIARNGDKTTFTYTPPSTLQESTTPLSGTIVVYGRFGLLPSQAALGAPLGLDHRIYLPLILR